MAKEIEQTNPYHVSETRRDPNTGELNTQPTDSSVGKDETPAEKIEH